VEKEEDQRAAQTDLITPMLYLGEPPSDVTTVPVELAEDALHVIRAGGVALLPRNRWDLASDVLELLGRVSYRAASQMKMLRKIAPPRKTRASLS